ncbi:hypothetical protein H2203_002208 [Taxawa tesnikishii (nom. ined.)]|nr:hypothetical protein H2203_002208 [Dothideales sp. JES 119]
MEKPPSSSGAKPSPSSHRLPTVSASDALKSLQANGPRTVATGLGSLDSLLSNKGDVLLSTTHAGGLERGKITEVWGPPGAGKTAFA